MKPIIQKLWIVLALLWLSLSASAYDFSVGGIYYTISGSTTAEVTNIYGNTGCYSGDIIIPEKIQYIGKVYTVTSIGGPAFRGCTGLTSITIPNSVTSIGEDAFYGCSGLTSVILPPSVKKVGTDAFSNCTRLYKSAYPLTLGENPFLNGFVIGYDPKDAIIENNFIWGPNKSSILFAPVTLTGEYTIPNSVTSIGMGAFANCWRLTSVSIPNSVISIGESAFYDCTGLTSVSLPNSVTSIGMGTFAYCSRLTSVSIPNSVTSIGESAFKDCKGLISVSIPNSVTSIGESAFYCCSELRSVILPPSVKKVGTNAFSGAGTRKSAYPLTLGKNPFFNGLGIGYDPKDAIIENNFIWGPNKSSILFAPMTLTGEYTIPNSVTSIGMAAFAYCSGLTSVSIPNFVTSIGESAFYNCSGLTSLGIPNSVTSIGGYAFDSCYGLTSVSIPNSVTLIGRSAFQECTGLTSVSIPNSVTSIGMSAFQGCTGLTAVSIPNSVTSIGMSAFQGCTGLTAVSIPNSVTSIGMSAFQGCTGLTAVSIPNSVTSIRESTFQGCTGLTAVSIPNSVTSIEKKGFYNCKGLTSVTIGNSVASIRQSAFEGCTGLTSVTMGNSVASIGQSAFEDCTGLTSVILPHSVTMVDRYAFENCSGLVKSAYPKTLGVSPFSNGFAIGYTEACIIEDGFIWGSSAKSEIVFAPLTLNGEYTIPSSVTFINLAFYGCTGLTSITIPNSVTRIGNYAFRGCTGLTSITIPISVTSIENHAFRGCTGLTSITIPNSVTTIGASAFYDCSGLTSVSIPNSVTSIGAYAFYNCSGLTSVLLPPSVTEVGLGAFYGCENIIKYAYPNTLGYRPSYGIGVAYNPQGAIVEDGFIWGPNKSSILFVPHTFTGEYTIPTTVESIGNYAFSGCSGLTAVTIGNTVASIGSYAFEGCTGLTSVTIPNFVTNIGDGAFRNCSDLNTVTSYAGCAPFLGNNVFTGGGYESATLLIPKSSVVSYLGKKWVNFKSIKFTDSELTLKNYSDGTLDYHLLRGESEEEKNIAIVKQGNYSKLTTVSIPERFYADDSERYYVTGIGYASFDRGNYTSTTLKEVNFHSKSLVTTIGENAFRGNAAITAITLPGTVSYVGSNAFSNCQNLSKLKILSGDIRLTIDSIAFYNCPIAQLDVNRNWSSSELTPFGNKIETVLLGSKITNLPDCAFRNCSNLKSCVIPNSVTAVGRGAFAGCSLLSSVKIGSGLKAIADSTFKDCNLSKIILPPSVESIGHKAFASNRFLEVVAMGAKVRRIANSAFYRVPADSLLITAQTPPTASNTVFSIYGGCLYVQGDAAMSAYSNASNCWSKFDISKMKEPTGLTITVPENLQKKAGETFTLKATLTPANVDLPYVFWHSTNPQKAYIDHNGVVTVLQDIADDEDVEFIAETLYADGPVAKYSFNSGSSGIQDVVTDSDITSDLIDVYNLQGVRVLSGVESSEVKTLNPGIYIIRQGNKAKKIVVK